MKRITSEKNGQHNLEKNGQQMDDTVLTNSVVVFNGSGTRTGSEVRGLVCGAQVVPSAPTLVCYWTTMANDSCSRH
ncbi:unnamed protein product [Merluccius merluccius]